MMNVVHVKEERREAFERAFLERESHVHKAEGFAGFELLRRDRDGEYVVLSRWDNKETFQAWVNSDLFKMSHRHADGALAEGSEVRNYDVIDARVPA
ncbi:MAG TPA: antibiotic biosynthesis monooxygenase [Solirubrobacterales bacterium]|nr:antibiotic biosynthesis monooxygenase [Solirubrobacterales bacterium]